MQGHIHFTSPTQSRSFRTGILINQICNIQDFADLLSPVCFSLLTVSTCACFACNRKGWLEMHNDRGKVTYLQLSTYDLKTPEVYNQARCTQNHKHLFFDILCCYILQQ